MPLLGSSSSRRPTAPDQSHSSSLGALGYEPQPWSNSPMPVVPGLEPSATSHSPRATGPALWLQAWSPRVGATALDALLQGIQYFTGKLQVLHQYRCKVGNPSRSRGSAPAERDCGWTGCRTTCTEGGGTFPLAEKTERPPPRPPGCNVEAKRGSCQMDSISHQRRCNFSPSTLDSGGAGGGALTPRCSTCLRRSCTKDVMRQTIGKSNLFCTSSLIVS